MSLKQSHPHYDFLVILGYMGDILLGFEHTLKLCLHCTYINIHIADNLFSEPCQRQIQFMSMKLTVIP